MEYIINVMELNIKLKCCYNLLKERIQQYLLPLDSKVNIDFEITYDDLKLKEFHLNNLHLTIDEVEYILTSYIFYKKILAYDAFLIHSSAVSYQDKAYCFSANCGVGKSTHTSLYLKNMVGSYIINDDKPAYRLINNKFYVFGTPWSGKNDISKNIKVPLQSLCFLKQNPNNYINKLNNKEAIKKIMNQTLIIKNKNFLEKMLDLVGKLVSLYPIYELNCNMDDSACFLSYNTMKGE